MLASAQTGVTAVDDTGRMLNRRGIWWQIWMVLAVIWTLVASASAWIDLPRAQHMPHDPEFQSKLSTEAASILRGPDAAATPVRGALVWTGTPKTVRMLNGTRLTFPAFTPDKLAAVVENEYRQLLSVQADEQRGQFLLARLAIWLAPLLIAGLAVRLLCRAATSLNPHAETPTRWSAAWWREKQSVPFARRIDSRPLQMAKYSAVCSPTNS